MHGTFYFIMGVVHFVDCQPQSHNRSSRAADAPRCPLLRTTIRNERALGRTRVQVRELSESNSYHVLLLTNSCPTQDRTP